MATATKPNILDGYIVRPMTNDEYAQWQQDQVDAAAAAEADEAAAFAALVARKEPLRRLGLTEDEINTVLGL